MGPSERCLLWSNRHGEAVLLIFGVRGPPGARPGGDAIGKPVLFGRLAPWFHLLTKPAEYRHEASVYARLILAASRTKPKTLLELGSGGGNNASHLKKHFRMTLTDVSTAMLALSRTINPECEHIRGDMRSLRLRRRFDAVFVHDAICYMRTMSDLTAAIRTVAVHLRPGGVALFAPDVFRETFRAYTAHGGHDAKDKKKGMRFVEWVHEPDAGGTQYTVDYIYLLRDGASRTVGSDRHVQGLFSRAEWRAALRNGGFSVVRMERPAGCGHVILARKLRDESRGRQTRVRGPSGRKQVTQRVSR